MADRRVGPPARSAALPRNSRRAAFGTSDAAEGSPSRCHAPRPAETTGRKRSGQVRSAGSRSGSVLFDSGVPWRIGILEDLQTLIETGKLSSHRVGPLSSTLNNALAATEREKTNAAIGQMQAFINQINALLRAR